MGKGAVGARGLLGTDSRQHQQQQPALAANKPACRPLPGRDVTLRCIERTPAALVWLAALQPCVPGPVKLGPQTPSTHLYQSLAVPAFRLADLFAHLLYLLAHCHEVQVCGDLPVHC